MMFGSSYRIATVWGIPIKIHISLVLLLLYFAITRISAGIGALLTLLALEVLVFFSIALHELGHSFVALRKGCRVREITLMFIGGAAQMERIPSRPMDEFQMAIAGPLVSLALGFIGYFGGQEMVRSGLTYTGAVVTIAGELNFFLAGFNLLPSFPMDGGRVLRALLARRMGKLRATYIASRLGKFMAIVFGIYGFVEGNWLLVAIAFFIYSSAGTEYRMVQMEHARRNGYDFWPFPTPPPIDMGPAGDGDDDDRVIISPPPYREGPAQEADVQSSDDNPFRRLFR